MQAVVKTRRAAGGEVRTVPEPFRARTKCSCEFAPLRICGTDVHIWKWNEWAQTRVKRVPMIFGHELSGEVVKVGAGVRSLVVGDHVSAETHIVERDDPTSAAPVGCISARRCRCSAIDRDGVFAVYAVLPELNAWKNDPHLDPAIASIQEPLGNAVHSLLPEDNIEDLAGRSVLVTGCGPIGLLAILVARTLGAEKVVATEVNPVRIDLAWKMGADLVLNPVEEGDGILRKIQDASDGRGVDVAVEMSGHPNSLRLVFDALTPGGRVSLLGLFDEPATLDVDNALIFKAARVHGIFGRRMFETWYQVKGLLARSAFREKVAQIITHRVPIPEISRAMELLDSMQAAKVSLEAKW